MAPQLYAEARQHAKRDVIPARRDNPCRADARIGWRRIALIIAKRTGHMVGLIR